MRIKWLSIALNDIDEIATYISQDNISAAYKTIQIIWEKTKLLEQNQNIGRPGRVNSTRELCIDGTSYIIPYRIKNNTIEILRVLHTSRKWPDSFKL
jgi:toxin ParE1/3/4